jgi:hypothetical protein
VKELSKELDRLQLLVGPQTSEEEYSGNGNLSIRTDVSDKSFDSSKHKDGDRDKDRDTNSDAKKSNEIASSSKNLNDNDDNDHHQKTILELSQEIERLKMTCQSQSYVISELSTRSIPTGSQCCIQFLPNNQSDQVCKTSI